MKRLWIFCLVILFTGCFSRTSYMSRNTFDEIQMGTPVAEIEQKVGDPYKITRKGADLYEHEYIEKINMNYSYFIENHYFLLINQGKVIGKWYSQEKTKDYNLMYQADPNYPGYYYPGY